MKRLYVLLCALASVGGLHAQEIADSVTILDVTVVRGYLYERPITEVPASVGLLTQTQLDRFNNTSLLPVMNTIPGVRMEERSPGSYRFAIRGSAIRSPFGVRNVKMYWNGLPFTDAGGNTYLNLLDFSTADRIEIIKGPGGSLYGAGTGGVVLIHSEPRKRSGGEASAVLGGYGLRRYQARADVVTGRLSASVNFGHLESAGYRKQSAMRRDALNFQAYFDASAATTIGAYLLYSDLFYETPGGLTLEQFREDPRQARPAGFLPGAEDQNAHVRNPTVFAGLSLRHEWTDRFSTKMALYHSNSDFENFAIANYEKRDEGNTGLRLENSLSFGDGVKGKISFGTEVQLLGSPIGIYQNNGGAIGDRTIQDDLGTRQVVAFVQAEVDLPSEFYLTVGASETWLRYDFERTLPVNQNLEKGFPGEFSPRIALLKKLGDVSLYGSVSRGFSPPTLAEVRPSTNVFTPDLRPEKGTSFEAGVRGSVKTVSFDLTQYFFSLRETIVIQRDNAAGQDYFINAGRTKQRGTELTLSWKPSGPLSAWGAFAYNHYRFRDYGDFDGNEITGVPASTATVGFDVVTKAAVYGNFTWSYTAEVPLNDANNVYAGDYSLLNARIGYRGKINDKFAFDVFVSAENIFDETYSLGNDLNAAGNRYYNAAAGRVFSGGLAIKFAAK